MSIDDSNFNVVLEEVSDEGAHMLVVHFPKKTGGFGRLRIPRGLLLETAKARVLFANHGAILPEDCVAVFKALLEQEVPTIRVVRKAGWHERQYLSRFGRVGTKGEDKFKLATGEHKERKRITRGAAEAFREQIEPFLAASSFLLLAFIAALAAPLAARLRLMNGFALCLSGQSSTGKTTCLRLAQSLLTRANEADLESIGNTTGVLLDSLPSFGGQAISFGDLKADLSTKVAAEKLRTVLFAATGGSVRQRKGEEHRENPEFVILLLSAERPLHELFASNGVAFEDGEAVRLIDVPVPGRDAGGIFAGSEGSPGELIRSLDAVLAHQHGTVLDEWIDALASYKLKSLRRAVITLRKRFVDSLGVLPAHHARIADHFGLLAAAGSVAITIGALPASKKDVFEKISELLWSVLARIASRDSRTVEAWHAFFIFLERLPALEKGQRAPMPQLGGFRRGEGTPSERIFLRRDVLVQRIGEDLFSTVIEPGLVRAGCLPGEGEKTIPVKQAGLERARYFRISAASLLTLRQMLGPELTA